MFEGRSVMVEWPALVKTVVAAKLTLQNGEPLVHIGPPLWLDTSSQVRKNCLYEAQKNIAFFSIISTCFFVLVIFLKYLVKIDDLAISFFSA